MLTVMPDLAAALGDPLALLTLALVTLLHELGAPIPMSPAALAAGARAEGGAIGLIVPVLTIVAATLVGNAAWFAAGRRYGLDVLRLAGRVSVYLDNYARRGAEQFDRRGEWLLVVGRFLPGASLVAPPLAGAAGMRWSKFLLLTAAGSLLNGAVIVGAGMLLRHEVHSALDSLEHLGGYAAVALAGALAVYLAWRRRPPIRTAQPAEPQRAEAAQAAMAAAVPDGHTPQENMRRAAPTLGLDRLAGVLRQVIPVPCSAP